ncbi:hypothetical protein [Motiliproteus sediminis]|uniref:hypothetical protein n=1 Tax=Motiliproteus sediminis TaxID=1468178 RepID=UPI001AF012CD|nr:hypothetical protein [Motiliproteus sediminis]
MNFMTSITIPAVAIALVSTLGCRHEPGPLEGRWEGQLVSQGMVLDIGEVEFGPDYLKMGEGTIHHQQLRFNTDADQVAISQPNDPRAFVRVRVISSEHAQMTMEGVNGYIELSRDG